MFILYVLPALLLLRIMLMQGYSDDVAADDGCIVPTFRPWSDLPPELLSLVANGLDIIQLLAFRGVCKNWRSASSGASADCESELKTKPSFIVYDEVKKKCCLYHSGGTKAYGVSIPELENADCLASNHGWLLLHQRNQPGSLFFFCPFSRARIDLPECPESDLSDHVAAFSEPPTSHQCVVSVARRANKLNLKLYVLRRGEGKWASYEKVHHTELRSISAALYVAEKSSFYFMSDSKSVLKFSVEEKKWNAYNLLNAARRTEAVEYLPFYFEKDYFTEVDMKSWMRLEDDASISICGTPLPGHKYVHYLCSEQLEAANGIANSKLKGIWIQARYLQIPENFSGWNL